REGPAEIRRLRRAQAVEQCRWPVPLHSGMRKARACSHEPRTFGPTERSFNAVHLQRIDILADEICAARADETDTRKRARAMTHRHVGDRVLQAIEKASQR